MCKKVVCFDLDDTLYKEIDFVESAYREIATSVGHPDLAEKMVRWYHEGKNVFNERNSHLNIVVSTVEYLAIFHRHKPSISLSGGVEDTMAQLKDDGVVLGLITDGRSVTQRNKITALRLERWFEKDNIVISEEFGSEKVDGLCFRYFMDRYSRNSFTYVGDNPKKDFLVPNQLGWQTIMLKDDRRNIHKQYDVSEMLRPKVVVDRFEKIREFI